MNLPSIVLGTEHLWTPLPPEDVESVLGDWGTGTVGADAFDIDPEPTRIAPRWRGDYCAADGGTYVKVEFTADASSVLGVLFAFLLLGPFALLFVVPMALGLQRMRPLLHERAARALRVTDRGVDALRHRGRDAVSDPTSEGAAAGAPSRFAVRTTMDAAVFQVHGKARTTAVTVRRQGLSFERTGRTRRLDWEQLRSMRTDTGLLVFSTTTGEVRLDATAHAPADVEWLVRYLTARNEAWSARSEDEVARAALSRLEGERARG